ncbi:hypothetical protein VTN31DRAFT_7251 [Thermomyces dupontii]|uniref:uncharacterized protein n=1 Tax=Talaromyces thermophilus TaxID=28565 RepID=UPI003742A396
MSSDAKPVQPMDDHRKALQDRLTNRDEYVARIRALRAQSTYVSPSDNIMSPCTKKLSDLKGKRFKNAAKPTTLFANLSKKNLEQTSNE